MEALFVALTYSSLYLFTVSYSYNYWSTVFTLIECYPVGKNTAFTAKIRLILEINPSQRVKDTVDVELLQYFLQQQHGSNKTGECLKERKNVTLVGGNCCL